MSHVDTAKTITHVSLCAGYGGIDLGLGRAVPGLRTIAFSEIEAFACANLVAKMEAGLLDAAPIWTNLKTFPWDDFRDRVDILSGGYPCQPFSAAGKRAGADDPRHLWPYIADGIVRMRPRVCFFENVEGHITLGLRDVLQDLAGMGYRTTWGIFSASEVGAPHQRKRVFILAHRNGQRGQLPDQWRQPAIEMPVSNGEAWGDELADTGCLESQGRTGSKEGQQSGGRRLSWCESASCHDQVWPSRPGEPQHGWEPPRVVGNTSQRKDHRREPGNMGGEAGERRCVDHAVDGSGEGMGNAAKQGLSICGGKPATMGEPGAEPKPERPNESSGGLADNQCDINGRPNGSRRREREQGQAEAFGNVGNGNGEIEQPMGLHFDGPSNGLGHAELSGLCDTELAEIYEWMVTCDNRTDELRLLGNGVVPATAEKAYRTLAKELAE